MFVDLPSLISRWNERAILCFLEQLAREGSTAAENDVGNALREFLSASKFSQHPLSEDASSVWSQNHLSKSCDPVLRPLGENLTEDA